MDRKKVISLRMERQHLICKADGSEYLQLYRDTQPGQNVYWNGFGQPPTLVFRAAFDDIEYNRSRQLKRELIKGRFSGGNLGWIVREDIELFASVYRKPLTAPTETQKQILELIEKLGPLTIQQIKEETGMLVKEITPVLHRLQQAFLVYEDQFDGEWDRGWYKFEQMFKNADLCRFSRIDALKTLLERFSCRLVWFDSAMARSFYKLPERDIRTAIGELVSERILTPVDGGFMLTSDNELLSGYTPLDIRSVFALHRNDILVKAHEHLLKPFANSLTAGLEYDCEPLQYLLIDGEFHGALVGHFRNGPNDLNDIVCDIDAAERKDEIIKAVRDTNGSRTPTRFMGALI